ncbi:hypothetical protein [Oryza sativa Japonica Group]|uniref:Uncharacterized protein n=1 Tax=Oryza sativa subsp. japonica TaxID=39947 RepID=Q5ZDY8_ORYSJ|nr:hypothetical protein [Oryza sativa Japonica Group]
MSVSSYSHPPPCHEHRHKLGVARSGRHKLKGGYIHRHTDEAVINAAFMVLVEESGTYVRFPPAPNKEDLYAAKLYVGKALAIDEVCQEPCESTSAHALIYIKDIKT